MKPSKEWVQAIIAAVPSPKMFFGVEFDEEALARVVAVIQSDAIRSIQRAQLEALALVAEQHWVKCDAAPMPDIPELIHKLKEAL